MGLSYLRFYSYRGGLLWIIMRKKELFILVTDVNNYYTNRNEIGFFRYPVKHCGQDHFKCPYYWGVGEPLGPVNDENVHLPFYEHLNNYNQRF